MNYRLSNCRLKVFLTFLSAIGSNNCHGQENALHDRRVSETPLGLALIAIDSLQSDGIRLYASEQISRATARTGDYETALLIVHDYQPAVHRQNTISNIADEMVAMHSTIDARSELL